MHSLSCDNPTSTFHLSMKPWVHKCTHYKLQDQYRRNVWRFWLDELAEMWSILLKNCSMLDDIYNAQKNASIIYLGLTITHFSTSVWGSMNTSILTPLTLCNSHTSSIYLLQVSSALHVLQSIILCITTTQYTQKRTGVLQLRNTT